MHARQVIALDLDHLIAVTFEQPANLAGRFATKDGRAGDLRSVEVKDRQHGAIPHRVEERDALP
jgi:hypothetical protein